MKNHFSNQRIALLTQHGKEAVMAPLLEPALDCSIVHVSDFDTDQLGTFTRDVARAGSQLEAARRKARIGMEHAGLPIGLASEGSFGLDPFTGMFAWNIEMVVLIDDRIGIEVVGIAQGPGRSDHITASEWSSLAEFAEREGFPTHQLVLRPDNKDNARIIKGIADWDSLKAAYETCVSISERREVFAETDLRAFANPTRMQRIGEATKELLLRLQSYCPVCSSPGYAVTRSVPGLPCAECGSATNAKAAECWTCVRCNHQKLVACAGPSHADPKYCNQCNP